VGVLTPSNGVTRSEAWQRLCGITVSELYSANPGISGYLYAGQVLTIPNDSNYDNYNNYNGYGSTSYNYNYAPTSSNGTYVVQVGDTFSEIASRYGVSVNALWNANPYIGNVNLLYPGQVLISHQHPIMQRLCPSRHITRHNLDHPGMDLNLILHGTDIILPTVVRRYADSHRGFGAAIRRECVCRKPNRDHRIIQ